MEDLAHAEADQTRPAWPSTRRAGCGATSSQIMSAGGSQVVNAVLREKEHIAHGVQIIVQSFARAAA